MTCSNLFLSLSVPQIHHPNMQCTVSPHNAVDPLQLTHSEKGVQRSIQSSNGDVSLDDIAGNCSVTGTSTAHIVWSKALHMYTRIHACMCLCEWAQNGLFPNMAHSLFLSHHFRYVMPTSQVVQLLYAMSVPIGRALSTQCLFQRTLMTSSIRLAIVKSLWCGYKMSELRYWILYVHVS